jgi:hypothetical protein
VSGFPREVLKDARLGAAILVFGVLALGGRAALVSRATTRAERRARDIEARIAELDELAPEVAALRSSVAPRAELEKELGRLRPLVAADRDAVLARLRETCRRHAAPGTFDARRDVRALAPVEIAAGPGKKRYRIPVQLSVSTNWSRLAPLLDELRAEPELVVLQSAGFERGEHPLVNVSLELAFCSGEGGGS